MVRIEREALVHRPKERLLALVQDVEAYPEFLPWCRRGEIIRREGERVEAALEIASFGLSLRFATRNILLQSPEEDRLVMELLEGPFRHLHGVWRFKPLGRGGCKVSFSLEFEMEGLPLAAPIFGKLAGQLVEAFVRRAYEVE